MKRNDAERLKEIKEVSDLRRLIDKIKTLWKALSFDEKEAREIIQEVNRSHPENTLLYNLMTYQPNENSSNSGSGISIDAATQSQLQEDLQWKHFYLNAKLLGKGAETIIREWKNSDR